MKATKILKATLHGLGINNNDDWKAAGIDKVLHIDQNMEIRFLMTDGTTTKAKYPDTSLSPDDDTIEITIGDFNDVMVSGTTQKIEISIDGAALSSITPTVTNATVTLTTETANTGYITISDVNVGEIEVKLTHASGELELILIEGIEK